MGYWYSPPFGIADAPSTRGPSIPSNRQYWSHDHAIAGRAYFRESTISYVSVDAFIMRMPEEIVPALDATHDAPYGHREAQLRAKQKLATKRCRAAYTMYWAHEFLVSDPNTRAMG
jgi:hypothetical protein